MLNNESKGIDFLAKNRLIYIFQKNIVKNKKISKYFDWFELAEKTKDKENEENDFIKYKKNKTFMAVIQRINKDKLESEDFTYIDDYEKFVIQNKLHEDVLIKNLSKELRRELTQEVRKEVTQEVRKEVTQEVRKEVTQEVRIEGVKEGILTTLIAAYEEGLALDLIAKITKLPIEKVKEAIEDYKRK